MDFYEYRQKKIAELVETANEMRELGFSDSEIEEWESQQHIPTLSDIYI
jgi:hypothetical protein